MYTVSEQYKEAIQKSNPSYLTGTLTFKDGSSRELSNADIALGGASITMQAVTQDILEFGAAILGQLDISIRTDKSESRYKYYGAKIELIFTVELSEETESIPLGIWTIAEAEREGVALKISAYDNLVELDEDYTLTLTGTPFELMTVIAEDCECELAEDEEYYKSLPNGEEIISIIAGSSCNTYRQAAGIIAQMCGAFVQANREGKISFKQFSTTETFSVNPAQRYKCAAADYVCNYVGLDVTGLAGTFSSVTEEEVTGITMYIDDAPAWDSGLNEVLQVRADNLRAYLDNIQYTPCELLIPGDPSIDCGDYVKVESPEGDIYTLVTSYTWKFHGQMELQSVGKNPYLLNTSANKQRVLRNLEQNGGGGGAPMLYTFKNIRKFNCKAKLEPISQVTFVSTKDTFAVFDATLQIDVEVDDITKTSSFSIVDAEGVSKIYEVPYTQPGTIDVTIQYYYNTGYMENPYTLTLGNGSHVITLHYPFANVKKDAINRFAVHMSCNGGKVSIPKEMFSGTITGSGLAGTPKWDGTITFDEYFTDITIPSITVCAISDELNIKEHVPGKSMISEQIGIISLGKISVFGFNDSLELNQVVTNYTFEPAKQDRYIYDKTHVLTNDGYKLRTSYSYDSIEETIDSGRACSVTIKTDDKTSVEGVDIIDGQILL